MRSVAVVRGSAPEREAPRLRLHEAIADLLVGLTQQAPVDSGDEVGRMAKALAVFRDHFGKGLPTSIDEVLTDAALLFANAQGRS